MRVKSSYYIRAQLIREGSFSSKLNCVSCLPHIALSRRGTETTIVHRLADDVCVVRTLTSPADPGLQPLLVRFIPILCDY